jgi:3-hydroxyisobutyrate dehydrogenase-like beta-hydroxyacid dehydrogenase
MTASPTIGFIGLGTMGEPMCGNLVRKSGAPVIAFDVAPEPLARLRAEGAAAAASVREVAAGADVVFVCLPSGRHVRELFEGPDGILASVRAQRGQTFVDLGTSPVGLARELAGRLGALGATFADAPIARTRQAAQDGTLSIMVGADQAVFARIEPLLRCCASEVTHCGPVGTGQVVKILNNMVLFETVNALAEALAIGRRAGVAPAMLLATFAKGSADSFALRNHGMKAMLPRTFPERAFSTEYALKDLGYALDLAREVGVSARGAEVVGAILADTVASGLGAAYWPALLEVVDRHPVIPAGREAREPGSG